MTYWNGARRGLLAMLVLATTIGCADPGGTRSGPPLDDRAAACVPGSDVEVSPGARFPTEPIWAEAATAAPMPSDVAYEATARFEGEHLVFVGTLRNDAAEPRRVVYLTGGVSGNPVGAIPALTRRPDPPGVTAPPEIYPEPRAVELEPGASVRYTLRFCLDAYEPPIPESVDIEWRYSAWTAGRSGRVTARR